MYTLVTDNRRKEVWLLWNIIPSCFSVTFYSLTEYTSVSSSHD